MATKLATATLPGLTKTASSDTMDTAAATVDAAVAHTADATTAPVASASRNGKPAATARIHITHYERSERANPSPVHVRSESVLAGPTLLDDDLHDVTTSDSLSAHLDDRMTISQPALPSMQQVPPSRRNHSRLGNLRPGTASSMSRSSFSHLNEDSGYHGNTGDGGVDLGGADHETDGYGGEMLMREENYLSQGRLSGITGIADLGTITFLELQVNTHHQSLGNFGSHVPNLKHLKLNGSPLKSLRDVGSQFDKLLFLGIAGCGLHTLDGLMGMPNLLELYAAHNFVSDLNSLLSADQLRVIDLEGNCIDDIGQIGCLALCLGLDTLTLLGNPLCTRPTPSDPDPTPGYDYVATVRRYMPGLKVLDEAPLGAARPSTAASLQRARPKSAAPSSRQRPMTSSGVRVHDEASAPSSRRGVRPLSARGLALQGSKLTESMHDLPDLSEDEMDSSVLGGGGVGEGRESAAGGGGSASSSSLVATGEVMQGTASRALRRLHQRPASSLSHRVFHGGDDQDPDGERRRHEPRVAITSAGDATAAAALVGDEKSMACHTTAPKKASKGDRSSSSSTTSSSNSDSRHAHRQQARGDMAPSTAAAASSSHIITPVMADTGRQRSEVLDELRHWRQTFDTGEELLRQATQLSPVRDGASVGQAHGGQPPPPPSPSSASSRSARKVRKLPRTPSVDTSDARGAAHQEAASRRASESNVMIGQLPPPPDGPPPPQYRRPVRPVTARASLQLLSRKTTSSSSGSGHGGDKRPTASSRAPPRGDSEQRRHHQQQQGDSVPIPGGPGEQPRVVRAGTEEQERIRQRLRGGVGGDVSGSRGLQRPSTAMDKKSGYLP
ncbi:uncharacterized protein LOC135827540 isoform X2 [Sycon ciliatum]